MEFIRLIGWMILAIFCLSFVVLGAIFYVLGYKEGTRWERLSESIVAVPLFVVTTGPFYPFFFYLYVSEACRDRRTSRI